MTALLATADRLRLDHRIAEERMIALDPPFECPDWLHEVLGGTFVPSAVIMDGAGGVAAGRVLLDEVYWPEVAAFRLETPSGSRLDRDDFGYDIDSFGDGEP